MTFAATRALFETALDAVPGIRGHQFRPGVVSPGDAWPLSGAGDRGPGDAFLVTWRIVVALGNDETAAEKLYDAKMPALVEAIEPLAWVERWDSGSIDTDGGKMLAVVIKAQREVDPT